MALPVYSGKRYYGQMVPYSQKGITVKNPLYQKGSVLQTKKVVAKGRYQKTSELKFFDTALSFLVDTTGEVPATGQLTLIPQGVTESTRIGRRCTIKSIQIRGTAVWNPAAGNVGATISYIYLVWDKQCNGAAASVTDVLTSNLMSTALANLENSDRFIILKRFVIPQQSEAGVNGAFSINQFPIDYYRKCNIPIDFDSSASTGALTTIKSNNLFLLAGSEAVTDDLVSVNGTCRLRFSDN